MNHVYVSNLHTHKSLSAQCEGMDPLGIVEGSFRCGVVVKSSIILAWLLVRFKRTYSETNMD